jgi:hypothetical protein
MVSGAGEAWKGGFSRPTFIGPLVVTVTHSYVYVLCVLEFYISDGGGVNHTEHTNY